MDSIGYYNRKAKEFVDRTIDQSRSKEMKRFLKYLEPGSYLLDAGCGSGRDTKAFLEMGYKMVAFDASEEMVKVSSSVAGQKTLQMKFQDLDFEKEFEGIWANASLLHVPYDEFRSVLVRLHQALKPSGILYASFKKGNQHRQVEDRHFYDQDESTLEPFIDGIFEEVESWDTEDLGKAANTTQLWYNVILRKK